MSTSAPMPADVVSELRDVFKLFDVEGDGELSVREIGSVLSNLGMELDENELQLLLEDVDEDESGSIDEGEFLNLMSRLLREQPVSAVEAAYGLLDKDGSQGLEAPEIRHVMRSYGERITEAEAEEMVAYADCHKEGVVSFEEFQKMMEMAMKPDAPG